MTDRELEQRLRAWYAEEVRATEAAPDDLRQSLAAIPLTTPTPLRPISRRRGFTLLGIAAVLTVGGAVAVGAGLVRLSTVTPPVPSQNALLSTSEPTPADAALQTQPVTPAPKANLRPGGLIAFIKSVDKPQRKDCSPLHPKCPTSRVWIVNTDGSGAHELFPDGIGNQRLLGWSPDGSRLLYTDDNKLYVTDPNGSQPQLADTGCAAPCAGDAGAAFSSDGRRLVFVRQTSTTTGADGQVIATMNLHTGQIAVLNSTVQDGGANPAWSPDGRQIVFYQYGGKGDGGPVPPPKDALFVVDADGRNLRQLTAPTLAGRSPAWSPDGARIVFVSEEGGPPDLYTIRPDGTDARRLTKDAEASSPTWTADGRILFTRNGPSAGFWTMDADGANATMLMSAATVGIAPQSVASAIPIWQPLGGATIVPPPWTPAQVAVVGPPAPTPSPPSPTAIPDLAPGFSWTGSMATQAGTVDVGTATRLADGRVLITGGCTTAAQLYDPATGTFGPTGSMGQVRPGATATALRDGRVLFAGGSLCASSGQDGMWASAELYDPATGTFSPTGPMAGPRDQHTATLLADGRVLIAGGMSGPSAATAGGIILASYQTAEVDSFLKSAEIYDPATGTFSKTGSMATPHRGHTATLLRDGRVLVVGNGGESTRSSTAADLYDPATGTWSKTGPMKTGRWLQTATLLPDGRVLIVGGRSPKDSVYTSAELYDPRTGKFTTTGSLGEGRQQQTATLLPDGRVFVAGGFWSDGQQWRDLSSTEMYDPATGTFSPVGSMGAPRSGQFATLLSDGRVLIVGGEAIGSRGGVGVASAVLFQP